MGEEVREVTVAAVIAVPIVAVVAVAIAALVAAVVIGRSRATVEVVTSLGCRGDLGCHGQKRGVPAPPNRASLLSSLSRIHRFCCLGRPPCCRGRPVPCCHGSHPRFGVPWVDESSPSTAQFCRCDVVIVVPVPPMSLSWPPPALLSSSQRPCCCGRPTHRRPRPVAVVIVATPCVIVTVSFVINIACHPSLSPNVAEGLQRHKGIA